MGFFELFLLGVGLSMDAFAVSVCKGLAMKKATLKSQMTCGLWFGGFQALMPLIGFFLGALFADAIKSFDHWIAFGLLVLIGVTTCVLSALGVKIGNIFGSRYEKKAEFAGGVILILLGLKILLEHLGVIV